VSSWPEDEVTPPPVDLPLIPPDIAPDIADQLEMLRGAVLDARRVEAGADGGAGGSFHHQHHGVLLLLLWLREHSLWQHRLCLHTSFEYLTLLKWPFRAVDHEPAC
jgi:hypothetical protein